jgi:hypothetical protein
MEMKLLLETERKADADRYRILLESLDLISKKKGWSLEGMDVLYKLFADKYHWLPSHVRSLTIDEIRVLLDDEPQ